MSTEKLIARKREECARKIKARLGLAEPPRLTVAKRGFDLLDDGWTYQLRRTTNVMEPPESYEEDLDEPLTGFRETYRQLYFDSDKNVPFQMHLLEPRVRLRKVSVSAGFSWLVTGTLLRSGQKFCAVNYQAVRELFRDCSLSSLLKLSEIRFATENDCTFIQTWHEADNPHFIAAITPSLKNEFILFHGSERGGEEYEDNGSVHLRKYFDEKHRYSEVTLRHGDGTIKLRSPDQNGRIGEYLVSVRARHPGKSIVKMSGLRNGKDRA